MDEQGKPSSLNDLSRRKFLSLSTGAISALKGNTLSTAASQVLAAERKRTQSALRSVRRLRIFSLKQDRISKNFDVSEAIPPEHLLSIGKKYVDGQILV